MALPLPTGLTAVPPPDNAIYHNDLDTAFPSLGLPTVTTASTGHRGHHNTLGGSLRGYGIEDDAVEDLAGHVLTHNRLHVFANILTRVYGQQASYAQPAGSVSVAAGTNLNQALLNAHPAGTKFWLQTGYHRPAADVGTMLVPKQNMEFHFAPGAVLSGSVVLTGWTSDGAGHWYVTGQTQRGVDGPQYIDPPANTVLTSPADHPRAWKSESVYIDNVFQKHQNALADVGAGEWFFDYAANRIYIGTDPAGKTVETTLADKAIVGGGPGVKIVNGIIEKFMCPLQVPALDNSSATGGTGWLVENTTVRLNHGVGMRNGDGGITRGCKVDTNGQLGLAGGGAGMIIEDTEVNHNNILDIDKWEAGGCKFVFSTSAIIRRSWWHHNGGNGIWFDINNRDPWIYDNLLEDNENCGIGLEIGYGGLVEWNLCRRNGTNYGNFGVIGAGVTISNTADVTVRYNASVDDAGGGVWGYRDGRSGGAEGWDMANLHVHDNLVVMHTGLPGGTDVAGTGIVDLTGSTAFQPAANNRFRNNTYVVGSIGYPFWFWNGVRVTWAGWQAAGQDTAGVVSEDTTAEQAAGTLIGWYDTQKQTGYSQGQSVGSLASFGGVAGPLGQTVGASQPTWQSSAINSHPAVRFDGVNDTMWTPDFGAVETQPNTVVLVVKMNATTGAHVLFDGQHLHATNRHIVRVSGTGQWEMWAGSFVASTGQTQNTTPHLIRVVFNGASSELYVDDALVASGNPGANSLGGITLGAWADLGDYASYDVGQVLVYAGVISGGTWTSLRDHLHTKWSFL